MIASQYICVGADSLQCTFSVGIGGQRCEVTHLGYRRNKEYS